MSLATRITEVVVRAATENKALRTLINGNQPDLAALTTTAKASLVSAVNEVAAAVADAAGIDDSVTSTTTSWSSSKNRQEIDAAVAGLVDAAPEALNTLAELAAALTAGDNAAAQLAADVANRVRFDAAQSLTAPQALQARSNIGAVSAADVGDVDADFVGTFEAGLI